ncbi:hypothetical protein LIA77_03384 [Sarocladium implicatum]|nr:hypothetical protein LIA77_03384 [Sarocladium implicatum]
MADTNDPPCSGKKWGFVAYNVVNAPRCIFLCRQRFLDSMDVHQDSKGRVVDETFAAVCEALSDSDKRRRDQPFWDLYCCDAQACGVDSVEGLGEDPNINWIINTCANIGYEAIVDPGPPHATYTYPYHAVHGQDPQCQRLKAATSSAASVSLHVDSVPTDKMLPTRTGGLLPDATTSSIVDPSLTASFHPHDKDEDHSHSESDYSTGKKVTIAVSVIVLIVILAALFCLFRIRALRKRRSEINDTSTHGPPSFTHTPSSSFPTPLIPSHRPDSAGTTPPLRLKERRLIPSGTWSSSSSMRHGSGFPQSPLYSPGRAKLIPRREEMRRVVKIHTAPLLENVGWSIEDGSIRSGKSSYTAASSTRSDHRVRSGCNSRSAASAQKIRHPSRVHSLASPGPAPNKKLPPTPVKGNHQSRAASLTRHGDVGVAIGLVNHNPANGVTLAGSARDLCELTEEYEREARNSGGSWSGNGGGGPGVALASPKKTYMSSPKTTLREDDLEKMGGGY